nr:hypothetical protein CFP56_22322 [Quercus suber]
MLPCITESASTPRTSLHLTGLRKAKSFICPAAMQALHASAQLLADWLRPTTVLLPEILRNIALSPTSSVLSSTRPRQSVPSVLRRRGRPITASMRCLLNIMSSEKCPAGSYYHGASMVELLRRFPHYTSMFTAEDVARSWKASHFGANHATDPHDARSRPDLAVDTSFTRHKGKLPQQVFPHKPRKEELTFIGINEVKKSKATGKPSFRQQVENIMAIRPAAQKSVSSSTQSENAESNRKSEVPVFAQSQTPNLSAGDAVAHIVPVHRRVKGLRPSPLDLASDVSPSDRAITIGIALPSAALAASYFNRRSPSQRMQGQQPSQEATTPTIIITPAKDDFEFNISPEDIRHTSGRRPASSVYSRFTTGAPLPTQPQQTPPVPPLPLSFARSGSNEHAVSDDEPDTQARGVTIERTISEDTTPVTRYPLTREVKRSYSQSTLNTPRRSKGWWNYITSPFSASSRSNHFFWQSPSLPEEDESREPIMSNASKMGRSGIHDGVIFTNRLSGDEALRSAPPTEAKSWEPSVLKRSDTAPGAYCNGQYAVNIYRIPSQGEAAAYYDPNRHFPSLILSSDGVKLDRDCLEDWSPSQSVYHPERERNSRAYSSVETDGVAKEDQKDEFSHGPNLSAREIPTTGSPDAVSRTPIALTGASAPSIRERNVFSTPPEEELASPPMAPSARKSTHPVVESYFSPLSATPVVEDAHAATVVGPKSSCGDLREIDIASTRTPVASGPVLATATMAHRELDQSPTPAHGLVTGMSWSEKATYKPLHSRNGSYGLGISDEERGLPSPAQSLSRKPTLGVDRFGQLEIRSFEKREGSDLPWYRRFLWILISVGALLLALTVVLLVVLMPQLHRDMPVEAQWVNSTAFPPLPTGVTTVINPTAADVVSGCVDTTALWSCDAPSGQDGIEQPNFRLEIRFRDGILPSNTTRLVRRTGTVTRAGSVVRRDAWSSSLFASVPPPPSANDQLFLAQTTDNVSSPYDGEQTPFYLSMLDPSKLDARSITKRQSDANPYPYPTTTASNSSSTTSTASGVPTQSVLTGAPTSIPAPMLSPTGEAAAELLYPYVIAQPLRLYNRGKDDEHYGFYSYFDRSILVANLSASTSPGLNPNITANMAPKNATAVCTFSQTRLHVQIWTRQSTVASLGTPVPLLGLGAANSTANDMAAAGSFPYAITITLDRHGGEADKKGVYCYGIDDEHHVDIDAATWIPENRAFQGVLVNPAGVPGAPTSKRDSSVSNSTQGIDGGAGGCKCSWQNWT